ncbi:arabinofuranosidase catalytic domain-containing protein [Ancylobacter sp. WKF20]|uniref:arabinofuranosidase catalytic domain-containing protein n=1 Tax=Ancylobacter sp. WKF20 TaxID=3039801 RepID=UPI0024346756|nr:arabinofuranosidase catalytic domain-containing protein [Ancylobacter sp. WKF20]WGD30404.1 arabinofuranosidase catalytic domain-containing protein [Ancylobacter sp. WKF20]
MAVRIGPSLALATARRRAGARRAPLDGIAPYAAHGLQRLLSSYRGPLLRARRGSDNAQADFYPRGDGWLDVAALTAWGGSASVFLVTLYDQTGNGRHAGQTTVGAQPRLALSGVADLGPNGRPVAVFDGADDWLLLADSVGFSPAQANLTLATVAARAGANAAAGNQQLVYAPTGGSTVLTRASLAFFSTDSYRCAAGGRRLDTDSFVRVTAATAPAVGSWNRLVGRLRYGAAQADIAINGASTSGAFQAAGSTSATAQSAGVMIGANHSPAEFFAGALTGTVIAQSALDLAALDTALTQLLP